MVSAFFNSEIKPAILKELTSVKNSIQICMAWMTDNDFIEPIIEKAEAGVKVEIIIRADANNLVEHPVTNNVFDVQILEVHKVNLKKLFDAGGEIIVYPTQFVKIHHKFAVIDDSTVITGSYNWSKAAKWSKENIVIIKDSNTALKFHNEFNDIKKLRHAEIVPEITNRCKTCNSSVAKIQVIDYRTQTQYFLNDIYTFEICLDNPDEHFQNFSSKEEADNIGYILESAWDENDVTESNSELLDAIRIRNINKDIIEFIQTVDSLFLKRYFNTVLGLYNLNRDEDGYDTINTIWEHPILSDISITEYSESIVDYINWH